MMTSGVNPLPRARRWLPAGAQRSPFASAASALAVVALSTLASCSVTRAAYVRYELLQRVGDVSYDAPPQRLFAVAEEILSARGLKMVATADTLQSDWFRQSVHPSEGFQSQVRIVVALERVAEDRHGLRIFSLHKSLTDRTAGPLAGPLPKDQHQANRLLALVDLQNDQTELERHARAAHVKRELELEWEVLRHLDRATAQRLEAQ